MNRVVVTSEPLPYRQIVEARQHRIIADVAGELGGEDAGPNPHELLLAALGSCTAMTIRMYAARKGWPLTDVTVALAEESTGEKTPAGYPVTRIVKDIGLAGDLDDDQRARLLAVAEKCPVNQLLLGEVRMAHASKA